MNWQTQDILKAAKEVVAEAAWEFCPVKCDGA